VKKVVKADQNESDGTVYEVSFTFKGDDEDVRAMRKYFFEAMKENMQIRCYDLQIKIL